VEASWHLGQAWSVVSAAITFAVVLVTFLVAHNLADHVLGQNDFQAVHKMEKSRRGWAALLGHVFRYHVVMIIMTLIVIVALGLTVSPLGLALGFLFSMITHGFIDRRWPVKWLLQHTGSAGFAEMQTPINGMYQGDQSLHEAALLISALIVACL
jgi:uncharacterized protein DUF3307